MCGPCKAFFVPVKTLFQERLSGCEHKITSGSWETGPVHLILRSGNPLKDLGPKAFKDLPSWMATIPAFTSRWQEFHTVVQCPYDVHFPSFSSFPQQMYGVVPQLSEESPSASTHCSQSISAKLFSGNPTSILELPASEHAS